jgi:hypothetical protein
MNPYAVSTVIHQPRVKTKLAYFAIAAYLVYASVVIFNLGGPSKAFSQYSRSPIGLVIEACLLLAVSGFAAWLGSFWLDSNISKRSATISRTIGGIAFGTSLVTSQRYLFFPYFSGLLTPLEKTPLDAIARLYAIIFSQPYIIMPTIILSGVVSWAVERLWRRFLSATRATNQEMHGSDGQCFS